MSTELLLEVNQAATVMDVCAPASFTVCLPNRPESPVISYRASQSGFSKASAEVRSTSGTVQEFSYSNNELFQEGAVNFIQ